MNTEKDFTGKVAVKGIIIQSDKVLIVRDHHDTDLWEFPGGHLDIDENIEDALKREIKEELGVEVKIGSLIYSEQLIHKGRGTPHLFIMCSATLMDPNRPLNVPSEEVAEARWVDKESVKGLELYQECVNALKVLWA